MRGWLIGAVVLLILAGGLAAFAVGWFPADPPAEVIADVSPAAAASAEVKLAQLDAPGEEVRLTAVELTSLFRYRPEIWSLGVVTAPLVTMSGDTLHLQGSLATAELPAEPEIERLRPLFPDTVQVDLVGTVHPLGPAMTVFEIGGVEVAGMPIPSRYYGTLLSRMGQGPERNLPPGALALPLPAGIAGARVQNGELVLNR